MKKQQIIRLLQAYSETCESQSGDKGHVIWEDDFEKLADEFVEILNTPKTITDGKMRKLIFDNPDAVSAFRVDGIKPGSRVNIAISKEHLIISWEIKDEK